MNSATDEWRQHAACTDLPKEVFFLERGYVERDVEQAKGWCAACPVRLECLDYALAHPDWTRFGIWGGTTQKERRSILRTRRRVA